MTLLTLKLSARLGAAIAFGLGCSGCAHFKPEPLSPAQASQDFQARRLDDPQLKEFLARNGASGTGTWPLASWDVTNLVLAGLFNHPDLDVARAKWAVAKAGNRTAGERPNPTLGISPAYNTTTSIPSPWIVTPTLDIPLETAGKRGYRIQQATQLSEAARLNIASVAWAVRSRVRQRFIEVYTAQEMESLLQQQQTLQSENLRLLENQYQAGAVSLFEVTQGRMNANSARLALRDVQQQKMEARAQLADAVGVPLRALEGVELSFAGLTELPGKILAEEARRQALLSRADILGALAQYAASQAALQLEIAKQYPDVHLNPGYEFDQGDNKWSLGLTVTLPVFNRNQGAIAEAEAKRQEAAATFYALQAGVIGEIERAVASFHVTLEKRADTEALRDNLLKQEKTAQAMLDAGEISKAELTALRLQLSAVAVARLDALSKSQQALRQLEDALQSPVGLSPSSWQNSPRLPDTSRATLEP